MANDNGIQSKVLEISQYIEELQRQSLDIPDKVTKALATALDELKVSLEVYRPDSSLHPDSGPRPSDEALPLYTPKEERTTELELANARLQEEIAERKEAEDAVKAERQRFNDVLETLPAYLVLLTPDYHVSFANRFFRERFGESHGKRCFEFLFGRSEPCKTCETYKVLKTQEPRRWEWTGPDDRNYDIFDFPFKDTEGSTLIMEMGIDITERKRAEEAVRRSEAKYRSLLSNIPQKIFYKDRNSVYIAANPSYAEDLGISPEDLAGKTDYDFFSKEMAEKYRSDDQRIMLSGITEEMDEIYPYQGETRIVHTLKAPVRDEHDCILGVLGIFWDITERKQAEETIRTRALQQEVVAQLGLQAMAGSDPVTLMDEAVVELAKTLGVEYTQVLELMPDGRELFLVSGVGWKDGLVGRTTVGSGRDLQAGYTLQSSEPVIVEDLRTETRFSGPQLLHEHGVTSGMSVVISSHGRPFGVLGVHTISQRIFTADDVHFLQAIANLIAMVVEQKRVESELEEHREHLEELVQERTHELEAANADLHAEIAERKRAETALRESEQRFRDAIDNFPNVFVIYGPDRRIQFVNSIGLEITGHREEDVIGRTDEEIFPPEIINSYLPALKRAVETKLPQTLERTRTASMGGQTIIINIIPLLDEHKEIRQILGITYDITERKRSEEALARERANLQTIFDVVNVGLLLIDENGIVKRINDTISQMVGIKDPSTLYGRQPGDLLGCIHAVNDPARCGHTPHCSACRIRNAFETVLRSGRSIHGVETEATFLTDGNEAHLWLEASVDPLILEGKLYAILAINNITERKLAEKELRESEKRMNRAQEIAHLGSWENDLLNNRLSWSDEVYRIFGLQPKEFDATYDAFLDIVHPDDRAAVDTAYSRSLHERKNSYESEHRIIRKSNGEVRVVHERCEHTRDDSGRIIRSVGMTHDITERKLAEEEIKKLNWDLQHRAAALEAANKELESFSYSVSHDLRTPLRAMDGFSRILQEDYSEKLPPEAKRYLQLVRSNAQQMGRLIDDLLAFSRLGRQPLNKQHVVTMDLVNRVIEELQSEQADRRIDIVIGDLPACEADPALLKQVFVNLISNAMKFTRKRETARIEIGNQLTDGKSVYFVKDNGAGFDMQYAHKLFGVFQRLHSADEYEGNGVGLANVQRIIHRHGGSIWAEGEVDRGATFYFTLGGGI